MEDLICGECGTPIGDSGCEHYNPKEKGWYYCIIKFENGEEYEEKIFFNGKNFTTNLEVKEWRTI